MKLIAYFLLYFAVAAAQAAEPCPPTHKDLEWSAACFEATGTERRVKQQYLRNIRSNKATIRIDGTFELLAVNRRGKVLVPHIWFAGDFDYPTAPGNVGRYGKGACGYFDTVTFKILVPAVYDHCTPFHENKGEVCTGCERLCTDDDCHDSVQAGGTGYTVNRKNQVLHTAPLPTREAICTRLQTPNTFSTESVNPSSPRPKIPFCESAGSASS